MRTGWSQHRCYVRECLQVTRDAGITLKVERCDFGKPVVEVAGSIVVYLQVDY